jgi:hypothetical protein
MTNLEAKKVNTTELPDEKFTKLVNSGFSITEIERWYAQMEYRKSYNLRPDVQTKRKLYNQTRNQRISMLNKLLKGGE